MAATAVLITRRTLLHKLRSMPGGPATAFRSRSTYPLRERENNSHSDGDSEVGGFCIPGVFHPFPQMWKNGTKLGGGRGASYMWEDEAGLHVRADMAGLAKEHVKVWVEGKVLRFLGVGPKGVGDCEGGDVADGRKYWANIRLPPRPFKLSEIQAVVKNGVLKILVPAVEEEHRHVQPVKVT